MKNIFKRAAALLCVIVLLSSMMAVPASADDWEFCFLNNNRSTISVSNARWGSWKTVHFKFRGTGIQRVAASPSTYAEYRGLWVYDWNYPGNWCYGEVQVRSTLGRKGSVVLYLFGSSAKAISISI